MDERVRWRTPHEWWDEKDQEWVVGGGKRPKPGDILEYEMRAKAIDTAIDRALDGAAVMVLADRRLETMSDRIVAIFERELAARGYKITAIGEG
jgi:hypothetical protein